MNRLPLSLAVAGIVPFVVLSVAVSMGLFPAPKPAVEVLLTYSAVILSFLGGIHWGVALQQYPKNRAMANLLIAEGVTPPLIAWGVIFSQVLHIQLLILTLLYTFMWAIDCLLYNRDVLPQWFFALRSIITPIVVVSLYVAYFGFI